MPFSFFYGPWHMEFLCSSMIKKAKEVSVELPALAQHRWKTSGLLQEVMLRFFSPHIVKLARK